MEIVGLVYFCCRLGCIIMPCKDGWMKGFITITDKKVVKFIEKTGTVKIAGQRRNGKN